MSRGFPSMTALLGLLAVAGYQNRDKLAEMFRNSGAGQPGAGAGAGAGDPIGKVVGNLSGMLGGAGVGGLLSGGIGELLEKFKQNGAGDTAESWINQGPNKEVSPPQLKQAIGPDVLAQLEQQTGLSQDELLARLSRELPTAVDRYTPEGRLPSA
ncbi:YidB family protein [Bradyrhizobium sp.]|uniref:YidB family protein n=1 Tax=Bradyrhizobium sp. TaxID=376 RepID=UPI0025C56E80|nr:YidB family protein [Bradyrhizobium sp.]